MMEDGQTQCGVVLVTAESRSQAEVIAEELVKAQLAAGVTIVPAYSIYTWKGEIHHKDEWQLLIQADLRHFDSLSAKVKELHSYEVPEIVALPIVAGFQPYLRWIADACQADRV